MFDTSTLNQAALRKLRTYTCPPTYRIDSHLGAGCYGDPPGFPTYFLRSVYTSHGNSPRDISHVIRDDGGTFRRIPEHDWRGTREEADARWDALMRSLWAPLPYNHPRVRAWIVATYKHLRHCYRDIAPGPYLKPPEHGGPATLIFPVPDYELATFTDDPRFSEAWRTAERANVERRNAETRALYAARCLPQYHAAYLTVQRYYPEHTPDLALIRVSDVTAAPGDWWETEDVQPTPATCTAGRVPGPLYRGCSDSTDRWSHPTGGTWCQWCGWTQPKPTGPTAFEYTGR